MEILLAITVFGLAMLGMSVGVLLRGRRLRGSCGGEGVFGPDGRRLSCGACPRRTSEGCLSDEDLARP